MVGYDPKMKYIKRKILLILMLACLYVLSVGPAFHVSRAVRGENVFDLLYGPLLSHAATPYTLFGDPLEVYLHLWGVPYK